MTRTPHTPYRHTHTPTARRNDPDLQRFSFLPLPLSTPWVLSFSLLPLLTRRNRGPRLRRTRSRETRHSRPAISELPPGPSRPPPSLRRRPQRKLRPGRGSPSQVAIAHRPRKVSNEDAAAITGTEAGSLAGVNGSALHPFGTQAPASGLPRPQRPRSKSRANPSSQLTAARAAPPTCAPLRSRSCCRDLLRGAGLGGSWGAWESRAWRLAAAVPGWMGFHASVSVRAESPSPSVNATSTIPVVIPLQVSAGQNLSPAPTRASPLGVLFRQPRFLSGVSTSPLQLVHIFLPVHFKLIP